jgi:glycosyltransferase involved in cell wall biosynthesis
MPKHRIAIVTTWFPPNTGVAVNRMEAFAKYLGDDFDLEVFTIGSATETVEKNGYRVHYFCTASFWDRFKHNSSDRKFIHNLKSVVQLIRHRLGASSYNRWKKWCINQLEKRHSDQPFQVVISSYAPSEPHEVVSEFKDNHKEVKWVADMRDEMSLNPYVDEHERNRLKVLEDSFKGKIDAITSISGPILNGFQEIFGPNVICVEIRNGYDHDVKSRTGSFNDQFTLTYAGTFYGKRKPDILLETIAELWNEEKLTRNLKIKFVGTSKNFNAPKEVLEKIELIPQVGYIEAVNIMAESDCNILLNPPTGTAGQFSGKVFDYISVQKPVLALVDTKDVAAELLNDIGVGFCADFYDKDAVANALLEVQEIWLNKKVLNVEEAKISSLHRSVEVNKLRTLLTKLIAD